VIRALTEFEVEHNSGSSWFRLPYLPTATAVTAFTASRCRLRSCAKLRWR